MTQNPKTKRTNLKKTDHHNRLKEKEKTGGERPSFKKTSHHDLFFKRGYSDPRFAKELFQLVFSKEELNFFDLNSLKAEKDTFQDLRADLVFSISLKNNPKRVWTIYLLLEHKSQFSPLCFIQALSYQTLIIRETGKGAGGFARPVLPVLFYNGKEPWKWKKTFQEGLWGKSFAEIPVSARKNMLNYELRVLDTHEERVKKAIRDKGFKSRGFLNALQKVRTLKAEETCLNEAVALFDNWPGDKDDLALSVGDYLWATVPGMTKDLWERVERTAVGKGIFSKGGYMNVKEYIREEARQEGLQQGLQTGRRQERQQVVLNMLKEKIDIPSICKVTGLSEEEIKKLKNGSR